jgi:hypothetical protein
MRPEETVRSGKTGLGRCAPGRRRPGLALDETLAVPAALTVADEKQGAWSLHDGSRRRSAASALPTPSVVESDPGRYLTSAGKPVDG